MRIHFPKDTAEVHWTSHVKKKMVFYGLSEQKIRSVMRNLKRKEDGIAPQTVAVMQRNDKPKRKEEIWVMYAETRSANGKSQIVTKNTIRNKRLAISVPKVVIISAWRYPGVSKAREGIPVPEDVMKELEKFAQMK